MPQSVRLMLPVASNRQAGWFWGVIAEGGIVVDQARAVAAVVAEPVDVDVVVRSTAVSILKSTVWPWSTLMSVAKPWIDGSPAPETSHSDCGVPGSEFSETISLGSAAAAIWIEFHWRMRSDHRGDERNEDDSTAQP